MPKVVGCVGSSVRYSLPYDRNQIRAGVCHPMTIWTHFQVCDRFMVKQAHSWCGARGLGCKKCGIYGTGHEVVLQAWKNGEDLFTIQGPATLCIGQQQFHRVLFVNILISSLIKPKSYKCETWKTDPTPDFTWLPSNQIKFWQKYMNSISQHQIF